MDSILADAGGPAGVVHRIGDLLSVFLEKRLVITLMRPMEIKSCVGKRARNCLFRVFPSDVHRAGPSGRDQKIIPLRPGNWAPQKVRV